MPAINFYRNLNDVYSPNYNQSLINFKQHSNECCPNQYENHTIHHYASSIGLHQNQTEYIFNKQSNQLNQLNENKFSDAINYLQIEEYFIDGLYYL